MAEADPTESFTIALPGGALPVTVRRHPRARRVSVRMDPRGGGAILTLPTAMRLHDGMAFVDRHRDWLSEVTAKTPPARPFAGGATIPFLGGLLIVVHDVGHRGHARIDGGRLVVGGGAPHLARRVRDALKREARSRFQRLTLEKAAATGENAGRVSIRDQTSRWGSCSAGGNLSFNWRLICAPGFVSDYVAAHEVAHLSHMNHSPAFWAVVSALTGQPREGRSWLRKNGASLHRIGVDNAR